MITSRKNDLIVKTARLKNKKYRNHEKAYLIEGNKLFFEALDKNVPVNRIFATQEWLEKNKLEFPADVIPVSKPVLEKLSSMISQEGVIAELPIIRPVRARFNKAILLDRISDPGNLGTIIRTADCAGFDQVFLTPGCADLYNQKTLRASMGSIFHLAIDIITGQEIEKLKRDGFQIIASSLDGEEIYMNEIDVPEKFLLVFGNESQGISDKIFDLCDKRIKIPIFGRAESLNVAIASAVIIYAYIDQKKK